MPNIILHVGLMKTGTTYLQQILCDNRDELRRNGWLYPGDRLNQQHEMYHVCGNLIPWVSATQQQHYGRIANDVLSEIRNSEAQVLLSSEALSSLDEVGIRHVMRQIGRPDRVIFTMRNLGRLIPSAWQQHVKGGGQMSLDEFVDELRKTHGEVSNGYWRSYAYGESVKRWSQVSRVPVELVVVPKQSKRPEDLWELFRAAVGLPELSRTDLSPDKHNFSLSRELTELLRVHNLSQDRAASRQRRISRRKEFLERYIFPVSTLGYGKKIVLSEKQRAIIRGWNTQERVTALEHARTVHGDASDLDEDALG